MDVIFDNLMRLGRGIGYMATNLRNGNLLIHIRKWLGRTIAFLLIHGVPIDGAAIQTGRGAGLKPT